MDMRVEKDTAKSIFMEIIEGFELDMLDKESADFKTIEAGLLPAIMRGRIEVDAEHYKVSYKLKTPIVFKDGEDPIEVLHFSIASSKLKNVKAMTRAAESGNPKPLIYQYACDDTPGLESERMLDNISHGDALAAGGIGALFLAF